MLFRSLLLVSVTGYSLLTVLTAVSTGLYDFILYQFLGRALMVTEIGIGAVVLAEELPARPSARWPGSKAHSLPILWFRGDFLFGLLYGPVLAPRLGILRHGHSYTSDLDDFRHNIR